MIKKNKINDALSLKPVDQVDKDKIKSQREKLLISHQASIGKLCDKNGNFIKTVHVDDVNDERKCNDWQSNLIEIYKDL